MFLRRYERRKSGKRHTYWALVESIRTGQGSRQRVVAYLGELRKSEQNGWALLGRRLDKKARPQPSLFDPPAFAKIKSGDVVLPTRTAEGRAGKTVRVRCVMMPDPAQKVLLNRLGLTIPQRLRYLEEVE
jgi:hypothetical protein